MHDLFSEEWRVLQRHPSIEASNHGRLKVRPYAAGMPHGGARLYEGSPVFGSIAASSGGFRFTVRMQGKTWRVARVVCEAWHGPPPFTGAVAMHRNQNGLDNRSSNLRWATKKEALNQENFLASIRGEGAPPLVRLARLLTSAGSFSATALPEEACRHAA